MDDDARKPEMTPVTPGSVPSLQSPAATDGDGERPDSWRDRIGPLQNACGAIAGSPLLLEVTVGVTEQQEGGTTIYFTLGEGACRV